MASELKVNVELSKTLFEEIGPVVKTRIQFDKIGRSEGIGFVEFEKPGLSRKAVERYNRKLHLT